MQRKTIGPFTLSDYAPTPVAFRAQVLAGLWASPKWLPSKFLYDRTGSRLFDEICELPEYYPTRTEVAILSAAVDEMARGLGPRPLLVELGSGSGLKTRLLLAALDHPAAYVAVDISRDELLSQTAQLADAFPNLELLPVCADYTLPFQLPRARKPTANVCFYFPGSTLGNLEDHEALAFLEHLRLLADGPCKLLLGTDMKKETWRIEAAYNDTRGVTAAFNLNLLTRINRELHGDFDTTAFSHRAFYDLARSRVEMHLVSGSDQTVHIDGVPIDFREGESLRTEYAHKYDPSGLAALAARAGFRVLQTWTDAEEFFSVQLLHAP